MPRTKPQEISPSSSELHRWQDVEGVEEAKDELREVVEFMRDPKRFRKLGAKVPKGILLHGPPGHGQDAARQGGRERVERALLRPVGLLVRRDVRRPRRRAHPAAVPPGAQGRTGDHLHRRARRRGCHPRQRHLRREGSDAQPAAGGARRLRRQRQRRRDRRLQPAREARPRAAAAGPLRPPDPRHAARPEGPPQHPPGPHARQAAGRGRGPRGDRPPDQRHDRRRPRQHLQRGRDLRRARAPRPTAHAATSRPRSSAWWPGCSRAA